MSVITTALLLQTNCSSYSFETLFLNGPALSVRLCELALEWSFVTATQACFKLALLIRNCLTPATLFYLSHNYLTHPLHNSLFCSPVQGASFSFSLNLCTHLSPLFLGPLSIPPPPITHSYYLPLHSSCFSPLPTVHIKTPVTLQSRFKYTDIYTHLTVYGRKLWPSFL